MSSVKPEFTGWRDAELSAWHRQLGFNMPMVDIDWLCCEYDHGTPVALVEYKRRRPESIDTGEANYRALLRLARSAGIPLFVVAYTKDLMEFNVLALSDKQPAWFQMGPAEYIRFLYDLRKRVPTMTQQEEFQLWVRFAAAALAGCAGNDQTSVDGIEATRAARLADELLAEARARLGDVMAGASE